MLTTPTTVKQRQVYLYYFIPVYTVRSFKTDQYWLGWCREGRWTSQSSRDWRRLWIDDLASWLLGDESATWPTPCSSVTLNWPGPDNWLLLLESQIGTLTHDCQWSSVLCVQVQCTKLPLSESLTGLYWSQVTKAKSLRWDTGNGFVVTYLLLCLHFVLNSE